MAKRRTDLPPGRVSTRRELAEAFKVTETTINAWLAKGAPGAVDGVYDIVALCEWHARHIRPGVDVRARYMAARASRIELEVDALRASLVERSVVDKENAVRNRVLKRALYDLTRRLAPKLEGRPVREMMGIMQAHVEGLLDEFADTEPC